MDESHLVVVAYDDEYKADEVRVALRRMQGEGLLQVDESAVSARGLDGKIRLSQDLDLTAEHMNQGHWLGILAAVVTGVQPLILAGTAAGAVIGKLTDHGITTSIMKEIGQRSRQGRRLCSSLDGPPPGYRAPSASAESGANRSAAGPGH